VRLLLLTCPVRRLIRRHKRDALSGYWNDIVLRRRQRFEGVIEVAPLRKRTSGGDTDSRSANIRLEISSRRQSATADTVGTVSYT
jgi:hypothetical protein